MENASKALIIAGAILIAILLITIAILLINSSRNMTNAGVVGMKSQNIQTFNAQFEQYQGKLTGSKVNFLIQTAIASNSSNPEHQVSVTYFSRNRKFLIYNKNLYNVTLHYWSESGYNDDFYRYLSRIDHDGLYTEDLVKPSSSSTQNVGYTDRILIENSNWNNLFL